MMFRKLIRPNLQQMIYTSHIETRPRCRAFFHNTRQRPKQRPKTISLTASFEPIPIKIATTFATLAAVATISTATVLSIDEIIHLQPSSSNPFVYKELTEGLKQRKIAEKELQAYLNQVRLDFHRIRVQSRSEEEFNVEMGRLKERVLAKQQSITFGVQDPHLRERYLRQYGCCKWTPRAVQLIKDLNCPLLEIGAGAGQWQQELSRHHIDVKAYDDRSNVSLPGHGGTVHVGGIEQIHIHPERTLFLCYPPVGPMALECLTSYTGDYFIYVGEGIDGVNGSKEFFNEIEKNWNVVAIDRLDPFPQCFERLFIFKRKE